MSMDSGDMMLVGGVVLGLIVALGFIKTIFRIIMFQVVARMFTGPGLAVLLPALGLSGAMFVGGDSSSEPIQQSGGFGVQQGMAQLGSYAGQASSSGVVGKIKDGSCSLVLDSLEAMSDISLISGPANALRNTAINVCY